MDSDIINMEEYIMTMKNMFNTMCGTIIKTPASKDVRFIIMWSIIEHVLPVDDELLPVLVVTEHLLWVCIMTNLTFLVAGVLIMVAHMVLNMFFMVHVDVVTVHLVSILQMALKLPCVAHKSKSH